MTTVGMKIKMFARNGLHDKPQAAACFPTFPRAPLLVADPEMVGMLARPTGLAARTS